MHKGLSDQGTRRDSRTTVGLHTLNKTVLGATIGVGVARRVVRGLVITSDERGRETVRGGRLRSAEEVTTLVVVNGDFLVDGEGDTLVVDKLVYTPTIFRDIHQTLQ